MQVTTNPVHLEQQVKDLRTILTEASKRPGHQGAGARLALAVMPAFVVALAAELRSGTVPDHVLTAVADLAGNLIETAAETMGEAHADQRRIIEAMLPRAAVVAFDALAAALPAEPAADNDTVN